MKFPLPLLFLSLPLSAQTTALDAYFDKAITAFPTTNVTADAPTKKLGIGAIAKQRTAVWQAWCDANNRWAAKQTSTNDAPCLLPLDSLSKGANGRWALPSSLEPSATMPYYYGAKGARPASGYPLFLYLHGSGPKTHEWATGLILAKRFADAPSAYFVPQIPNEGEWYRWYQRSKQWAWEQLLRQALASRDINPRRLYLFGISEGGYGSQRLASFYADYLAAAGPMAGGEPLKNAPAENVQHIGFSLLTGAEDKGFYRDRLTRYTLQALDSLEHLSPAAFRHRVTLIPGRGHAIDYSPTTPWLSHFERTPRPAKFMWEDFEMDGRHRQGFYNLAVLRRPVDSLRTRYDVDICRETNTVSIVVENVHYTCSERDPHWGIELRSARRYTPATSGRLRVYLDETLVNLYRPVTILVNGRRAFSGKLAPNLASMASALALFADPERIFPVSAEVEVK